MTQKFKLTTFMIALVAVLSLSLLSSCDNDNLVTVYTVPSFKATNVSVEKGDSLTALCDKKVVNLDYNVTITINGEPQIFTGSYCSDELPVMEGNKVKIEASFDDNALTTNICFTMPDGSKEIVTKTDPVCEWIVPANFKTGDKIFAQWVDNFGNIQSEILTSSITLVALEK